MEHFFTEDNISIFLIQLIALLGFSKILGSVCRKIGLSYVVGEILTGIIMGPTILKRILPGVYHFIFRADQIQFFMLETTSLFGSLFLLLIIGFNLHMGSIKKQLGTTLKAGIAGSMIPFILSLAVYTFIPEKYMGGNATKLAFVIFLAASSAVNSIPVIAKVLFDFGLIKSDLGLITLVSYTANDILLWVMFTISFSLVNLGSNSIMNFVITIGGLMLFCSAAFIFGSRLLTLFF